ncbi:PhnD/SsuA/transferrin family substrate-binding protein [Christensenellaceae bacterium OttesenSCG-928-M15]|nr:PhnD/SsuA/transferrin family substrate-binding protein [Christensenellaceae bacterium OttesenSCG-928-M15]
MIRNRKGMTLIVALLILALMAGCASAPAPEETAAPSPEGTLAPVVETTSPEPEPTKEPEDVIDDTLQVATLKGPTGMGMVKLMQDYEEGLTENAYSFSIAGAPDEVTGKLITGEVDIAALPVNLAATLYNKTEGEIVMIAVNTLGVLYVLEQGDTVQSIKDLEGKTVYATGQGATPEYILNYLLDKNGIKDQVTVEYKAEHAELATLLGAGEVTLGMLPEPNVTATLLKNSDLRIALDLTEEWNKVSEGTPLVQGCIVARKEVVLDRPDQIATFLREYEESTYYAIAEMEEAAKLIEKYEIMGSAAAAQKAIPNCNIVCISGESMSYAASGMIEMLFEADEKSVGGKMPGNDFYHVLNAG